MRSLSGSFHLPALSWTLSVLSCRITEYGLTGFFSLRVTWSHVGVKSPWLHFISFQQTLLNEVNGYCEKKTTVESTGCRLSAMSRKEDCDVIHNLIMTVQDRYKKLQQCTSERGRTLEEVKKSAKQVNVKVIPIKR